jgi:hypothetical protein
MLIACKCTSLYKNWIATQKVSHPTLELAMRFLVEFKVNENLHVTTFDTICMSSFHKKCVHHTMETTQNMVMDSCALHLNTTDGGFLGNFKNYIG